MLLVGTSLDRSYRSVEHHLLQQARPYPVAVFSQGLQGKAAGCTDVTVCFFVTSLLETFLCYLFVRNVCESCLVCFFVRNICETCLVCFFVTAFLLETFVRLV